MVFENCCVPVPPSVMSVTFYRPRVKRFEGVVVPYGVKRLQVLFNLKEYPDSILNLRIHEFDPLTAPPFPKTLRYLGLYGTNGVHNIKDLMLPPSLYRLYGTFDEKELQEFNLRAQKSSLPEDVHS